MRARRGGVTSERKAVYRRRSGAKREAKSAARQTHPMSPPSKDGRTGVDVLLCDKVRYEALPPIRRVRLSLREPLVVVKGPLCPPTIYCIRTTQV